MSDKYKNWKEVFESEEWKAVKGAPKSQITGDLLSRTEYLREIGSLAYSEEAYKLYLQKAGSEAGSEPDQLEIAL